MFDYQKQNSIFAQGVYHFAQNSASVQLSGRYKSHSSDPLAITIWSDDEGAGQLFESSIGFPSAVWFEGKTELGRSIWVMGIRPYQIIGTSKLEADAEIFILGDYDHMVRRDESFFIQAKVSSTSLIQPQWLYALSYDGTISRIGSTDKKRTGINWETEHGKFKLIDNYEYVDDTQINQPFVLRIQTHSLIIDFIPRADSDIKSILYQLPKYLDEDLSLLSFIGRQRIVAYEATAGSNRDGFETSVFCRYKTWRGFHSLPSDQTFLRLLIRPKKLQEGLFDYLLRAFRSSPHKSTIARTIPYLITSYEDGYMETHLVQAYAALESMVDGIGESLQQSYLVGNNAFKRLSEKIKDLINEEIRNPSIADGIIKKLPELRRRSFLDRLLFLLDEHKVNTDLIWPPETDKAKEFHELLRRRNLLIHTGSVGQGDIALFDLNRIQKLVELWILKLLDCPDDAINEHSLWRGAPINKFLHY